MSNYWIDGIMGVIVGDALGDPVQFMSREEILNRRKGPVTDMESGGAYNMPKGTWTDDGSLTLAALASIREFGRIDLEDIMRRFVAWYDDGEYTPFGQAFDIGNTCSVAIERFKREKDVTTCGGTSEYSNGNGSLMRIIPACLYAYDKKLPTDDAVRVVHEVSSLTHNHLRAKIACGLYYFCISSVLDEDGSLIERLQKGMDKGFSYYENDISNRVELAYYGRLRNLSEIALVSADKIKSTGYVVDSFEAAIWPLITTGNFKECELKAVNLGDDTDTVAAIAGGLAGVYYGYDDIPDDWLSVIQRRGWIEEMCSNL